jgi:hypothetical protein
MTDPEDGAMLNNQHRQGGPEFKSGPMITAAAFIGAGAALAIVGFAVGGSHLAQCIRRWVEEMEVPPSERAKMTVAQAKAALAAGAEAWQKPPQPQMKR